MRERICNFFLFVLSLQGFHFCKLCKTQIVKEKKDKYNVDRLIVLKLIPLIASL
jgi:hypothetical protein